MTRFMKCLLLMAAVCFAAAAPASAQQDYNIYNWYWIANDINPTSQVFSSASGTFVANNNSTYLSWLTLGTTNQYAITGAANNGSGLVRLALNATGNFQTGQYWNVAGTGVYDLNWKITVVDATHVDLQGSTFTTTVSAGNVSGQSVVPTAASIYQTIDAFNQTLPRPAKLSVSSATPANPLASYLYITYAGGSVSMPQADLPGSFPMGRQLVISNASDVDATLYAFDGVSEITLIPSGLTATVMLVGNDTANGTYVFWFDPPNGASCSAGTVNLTTEIVINGVVTHC